MKNILNRFLPLYTATLLLLLGSGLLTTWVSLALSQQQVSGRTIGLITAANYIGLVIGGKVGHNLIARVGHIRAYVACAGIITASVVGHMLSEAIGVWLVLRLVIGLCMMCQYMVLESWLNDQAESQQRGTIFGFYMVATYLGLAAGQIILTIAFAQLLTPLLIVALCFSLCLVPIALTTRTNMQSMTPAPLELSYFFRHIPRVLIVTLVTGMIIGGFYGMAPVYASQMLLTTSQVGVFMGVTIFAGLITQFPLSWLSDRYDRQQLLCGVAFIYVWADLPLVFITQGSFYLLLSIAFLASMLQFSLYPIAVAIANDRIKPERRVSLTACLLMAYGIGASIGPLVTGALMQSFGGNMLYLFFTCCGLTIFALSWVKLPVPISLQQEVIPHVPLTDGLVSSPLTAALNPVLDEEVVQQSMVIPTDEELSRKEDARSSIDENC